ncbi:SRPBCC domain-containing protein [Mycolicibacillus parakoreensis]|uniref:SRPBCC domain-containing protein n=1 Tax=Mycolicibacillus parakoreensis TaxID=1069221 RepID=A0ABY3TYU2_9MYCO|nr:SRPBCC domain-containing protein [Mycolicibacillus parakoreensis]MCV7314152.1 SRPBCC domain-containing protein [Mycolicibacillus parakoreensis]ULN52874.1 SRPBCC domain-containing protein [Mycolicibacillus parakoreensis]
MTEEMMKATVITSASAEAVFDVLADPSTHQMIDGTGWVQGSLDGELLTDVGQIFRMAMYHDNHPDKDYEMANRVEVLDRPHAIAWQPGQGPHERGNLIGHTEIEFGGWIWRYDLEPAEQDQTAVTLTYDWSKVPPHQRDIEFPPFDRCHLETSLQHLCVLAEARG